MPFYIVPNDYIYVIWYIQGTHMDPLKPSGIFWTKFVDLEQGVALDWLGDS